MITIKINETNVDVIRFGEVLYTFIHHRRSNNVLSAASIAEELYPFDEVEYVEEEE